MSDLREAAQQALEALEQPNAGLVPHNGKWMSIQSVAIAALRAALEQQAEPVQEPVAFVNAAHLQGLTLGLYGYVEIYTEESAGRVPLYTAPPQRPAEPVQERAHGVEEGGRMTAIRYWCPLRRAYVTEWVPVEMAFKLVGVV